MLSGLLRRAPRLPPRSAACERFLKALTKMQPLPLRVLDVGCTDPSVFAALAQPLDPAGPKRRVVGAVQVDPGDDEDAQVLAHLKKELEGFGVECVPLPSTDSLPAAVTAAGPFDAAVAEDLLSYVPQGPEGLLQGVHGALRPGGLLVGEIGMDGNLETFRRACYDVLWDEGIDAKLYDPYFFPTAAEFTAILQGCGYHVEAMKELNQKAAFPSQAGRQDVALLDYMHVGMGSAFLKGLPDVATKRRVVESVTNMCYHAMFSEGAWTYQALRLYFVAIKR